MKTEARSEFEAHYYHRVGKIRAAATAAAFLALGVVTASTAAALAPGAPTGVVAHMPNAVQRQLRDAELRKLIDVPRVSFESMMRKRARTALAMFGGRSAGVQPRSAPATRGE